MNEQNDGVFLNELNKKSQEEMNLFASVTYFRYLKELEIIEKKMKEKEPRDYSKDNKFVQFFKKNVNKLKQKETESLSAKKQEILNKIDDFKKDCTEKGVSFSYGSNGSDLKEFFNNCYIDDRFGMGKRYFAIMCAMDCLHEYYEKEETLKSLSLLLFEDASFIADLYAELEKNYREICREEYKGVEKGILIGIGIALAAYIVLPTAFTGLAACLSLIGEFPLGAVIFGGLTATTINVAVLSAGLFLEVLIGKAIFDKIKSNQITESFRKASPDEIKVMFAIKAILIQESKKVMNDTDFKNILDDSLKTLSDLRADQEYLYIVEKTNAKDAKEKRKMCNILVDKFAAVVGI